MMKKTRNVNGKATASQFLASYTSVEMNRKDRGVYTPYDWSIPRTWKRSPPGPDKRINRGSELSNKYITAMRSIILTFSLAAILLQVHAAQLVFKSDSAKFENLITTPQDASDPAAWDFDWSYSGIRYPRTLDELRVVHLRIYRM